MPTTTKLKSREELSFIAHNVWLQVTDCHPEAAISLLQQLQEETVRCCAEHSATEKLTAENERLRELVKEGWHHGFADGKAGEYGSDFAWKTSRIKELLDKSTTPNQGEQKR